MVRRALAWPLRALAAPARSGASMTFTALLCALTAPAWASPPPGAGQNAAQSLADEAEANPRLFMPAIELGVLWHAEPTVAPGPVFRTSVDYRFRRLNAPFVRLAYDATTARMTQRQGGTPRLVANLALHDISVGGGLRAGGPRVQGVAAALVGLQVAEVPSLRGRGDALVVGVRTQVGALATVGAGVEAYFSEDAAITLDLSARAISTPLQPGANPFAGALTLGLATAL
jgi:hypothetical protein